jgi:hypothetical protein
MFHVAEYSLTATANNWESLALTLRLRMARGRNFPYVARLFRKNAMVFQRD